jgi:SAM-dependent methyltransferase
MLDSRDRFSAVASAYHRHRPGYGPGVLDWILATTSVPAGAKVADIGCGTGIFSRLLAGRGLDVVGIDPNADMLAMARDAGGGPRYRSGDATGTGLPDASVDLATAAQAFHWFDKPAALAEMARIVRPGGGLALFWNVRDETRSPFVLAYHSTLERHGGPEEGRYLQAGRATGRDATREALEASPVFEGVALHELHHEIRMRARDFVPMTFTASYVRAMPPETQADFRAETERLVAEHAAADGSLAIPYRIDCWIARRSTP